MHVIAAYGLVGCIFAVSLVIAAAIWRWWPFFGDLLEEEGAERSVTLDGLRGFLAVGVFIHHAMATRELIITGEWQVPSGFAMLGHTSVVLFFMITGFLFWSRALAKPQGLLSLSFYRSRAFRILPLYLAALVPVAIVTAYHARLQHSPARELFASISTMLGMGIVDWKSVGTFHPGELLAGVFWTLGLEWKFYAVIPFLALFMVPKRRFALLVAVIAAWIIYRRTFQLVKHEFTFIFGMATAYFFALPRVRRVAPLRSIGIATITLILCLPALTPWPYGLVGHLLAFAVFAVIASGNGLFGLLTLKASRLLGTISYSTYLTHGLLLYAARPVLRQALHSESPQATFWLIVIGLAVVLVIMNALTYRWIEYPALTFEKRLRRRSVLDTAAALKVTAAQESQVTEDIAANPKQRQAGSVL